MENKNGEEPRVSRIKKTMRRIYNVAQYESLEVEVSFDEEIVWSTQEERRSKLNSLTKLLAIDLYKTSLDTMDVLEMKDYRAKLAKLSIKEFLDKQEAEDKKKAQASKN